MTTRLTILYRMSIYTYSIYPLLHILLRLKKNIFLAQNNKRSFNVFLFIFTDRWILSVAAFCSIKVYDILNHYYDLWLSYIDKNCSATLYINICCFSLHWNKNFNLKFTKIISLNVSFSDYVSRGSKKFGDKCESTLECGFPGSICDSKKKSCQCVEDLPVTNHIDKCGKGEMRVFFLLLKYLFEISSYNIERDTQI